MQPRIDGLSIAALAVILLLGTSLLKDAGPAAGAGLPPAQPAAAPSPEPTPDPQAFTAPYTSYTLTQGPHGASYGHLAIDLAAGEGTPVLSPVNAEVADLYHDEWGNPTLVLENEIYRVSLLHGDYTVSIGENVELGDVVGYESNRGYTVGWDGMPCWEHPGCGYHTHLNVFDKRLGDNVDPWGLINR